MGNHFELDFSSVIESGSFAIGLNLQLLYVSRPSAAIPARSSQEGGIMCQHAITVLVTSLVLAVAGLLPGPAQAQRDANGAAVQDLASKPIGKIVAATGSVTIERA